MGKSTITNTYMFDTMCIQVIVCFIAAICGATVITEFLRKFKSDKSIVWNLT